MLHRSIKKTTYLDVVRCWLIPSNGGLFGSTGKPIDLSLSANKIEVARINELKAQKPTVVVVNFSNPWVISEIETPSSNTLLATFGTTPEALLDVVCGKFNPVGKMPISVPVSKAVVETNLSDVPGYLKKGGYALIKFGDGIKY